MTIRYRALDLHSKRGTLCLRSPPHLRPSGYRRGGHGLRQWVLPVPDPVLRQPVGNVSAEPEPRFRRSVTRTGGPDENRHAWQQDNKPDRSP